LATAFWNCFNDLIDFSAESFALVNRSQVRTQGVKASVTLTPWSTGYRYPGFSGTAPQPSAAGRGVGIHRQGRDLTFGARATWVGRRPDTDFLIPLSGRTSADSFVKVDATVTVWLSPHL
jgi:hypothetical protein